jgi:hypothetical protein
VDPVPDPLLIRKSGSAGNRTRASGSVGRNSDQEPTVLCASVAPNYMQLIQLITVHRFKNGGQICRLVVRVPGYRSRGPGSIPGATRFSEK